jgi:aminomethyltransferase
VYDLSWRAKIAVSGEDRVRWLNGMVTNNIRDLNPGFGNYNFLLNAKGRILGDLYIYNRGDSLWIDTERSQAESLMKTLEHFIIMDDVELTDISEKVSAIAVQGPRAKQIVEAAGISIPKLEPMQFADLEWRGAGITLTPMESPEFTTYEIWSSAATLPQLWTAMIEAGAQAVGTRALEMFRVMSGVPKYGVDIRDTDLPQETRQEHALNFTKGCYIGQEIVERIRSRGAVHRTFTGFVVNDGTPSPGTKLVADNAEVGVITSVERVPTKDLGARTLALGYIRREALDRGASITFHGGGVTPHSLPFAFE